MSIAEHDVIELNPNVIGAYRLISSQPTARDRRVS
jgi:hypothetical protein